MKDFERFTAFSRPFVLASRNVFSTMLSTEIKTLKPHLKRGNLSSGDLMAIMTMSGQIQKDSEEKNFRALILLSWPMDTYLKLAGTMLMSTYTEFNEEIADVGKEIANIIMTNVKKDLKSLGYNVNMESPTLMQGANLEVPYPPQAHIVEVPVEFCYVDELSA